jgi:hypothetical protein
LHRYTICAYGNSRSNLINITYEVYSVDNTPDYGLMIGCSLGSLVVAVCSWVFWYWVCCARKRKTPTRREVAASRPPEDETPPETGGLLIIRIRGWFKSTPATAPELA